MTYPNFELYTDGSGHINGFGGWAALAVIDDGSSSVFRMGTACGTSVDRMEFTALLEGLQCVWELAMRMLAHNDSNWKPDVLWCSDRESLINSVKLVYARSNCPDLWPRFEFYEKIMAIKPYFMTDAVIKDCFYFQEVDLQSSVGYQMIKNYMSSKTKSDIQ